MSTPNGAPPLPGSPPSSPPVQPWAARPAERLDGRVGLNAVTRPLDRVLSAALPPGPARDLLQGAFLGHPLHPALTDLPIGFWTSAWVLDLVGGRRARPAAQRLVALGVLSAAPTIAAGLADWQRLGAAKRRSGVVHAAANVGATGAYAASWVQRRRGHWWRGMALGMLGAAAASVGGYLGGHLALAHDPDAHVCAAGQMDLG